MSFLKTFQYDQVVRDSTGSVVGRAVLDNHYPYEEGKPLHLALLTIPQKVVSDPLSFEFYVDGVAYRIPKSFMSTIRMSKGGGVFRINTVVLHPTSNGN